MRLASINIKFSNLGRCVYCADLNAGICSSFINNYLKLKATRKYFDIWTGKPAEVHANNDVLVEWKQMIYENMQSHAWILKVYW